MAILKQIETPDGFSAEYVRIPSIDITYYTYKDEEARRSGKQPAIQQRMNIDLHSLSAEHAAVMYSILKATEEMSGAEDLI